MFNQYEALKREIEALKKEIQTLKDDQIKQNRDYKDAMCNLDSDNVPELSKIVKEIRLVVKDGKVSGAFIVAAINDEESGAVIQADHISLDGKTITLNAKTKITIESKNFNVDTQGNMRCNNAEMNNAEMNNAEMNNAKINRSCVLASDLIRGTAMSVCGQFNDGEGNISNSELGVEVFGDEAYPMNDGFGNIRNIVWKTRYHRASKESRYQDEEGSVIIGPQRNVLYFERSGNGGHDEASVGISRGGSDEVVSFMRVGDTAFWISHRDGMDDEVATTASKISTGQMMPECIQNIITS